jgi:hypothetical protein
LGVRDSDPWGLDRRLTPMLRFPDGRSQQSAAAMVAGIALIEPELDQAISQPRPAFWEADSAERLGVAGKEE